MEFKHLNIRSEESRFKRVIWSRNGKKTIIYVALGAIAGLVLTLITSREPLSGIASGEIIKNILIGGFLGFFITNSPCARNKC